MKMSFRYVLGKKLYLDKLKNISRTKRGIHCLVYPTFDPLEILTTRILDVKLVIQDFWGKKVPWNDIISVLAVWTKWLKEIQAAIVN